MNGKTALVKYRNNAISYKKKSANARSNDDPKLGIFIFIDVPDNPKKSNGGDYDHDDPKKNERETRFVCKSLSMQNYRTRLNPYHGRQENIETLDQKTECHDGNSRANPC